MRALQYRAFGAPPEVLPLDDPEPRHGQVLLRVSAAGACASDLHIMRLPPPQYLARYPMPLTLGHEGAGVIVALGDEAGAFSVGDAVAVYGPWGCGSCRKCAEGKENYCTEASRLRIRREGSMAEFMLVDSARHLVPLGDLDPVANVALTDAGLTPYSAIKQALPVLGAGSTALVIGVGGLGHVAIQLLRALTPATVVALDVDEDRLALAGEVGAHQAVLSGQAAGTAVRDIVGGRGVDAVFDFVGTQSTVELAGSVTAAEGHISVLGLGGGALAVGMGSTAPGVRVQAPYWGSRSELLEVIELARAGAVTVRTQVFGLDEAPRAYELLAQGRVAGRAVVVP